MTWDKKRNRLDYDVTTNFRDDSWRGAVFIRFYGSLPWRDCLYTNRTC